MRVLAWLVVACGLLGLALPSAAQAEVQPPTARARNGPLRTAETVAILRI